MFQSKKNIIAGRNPVMEALQSDGLVDKILMAKNASGEQVQQIRLKAKDRQIPIQWVPVEKLNQLTNIQHQGVVAYKAALRYADVQQVIDSLNDQGEAPLFLILDGITDVRNIGAIARTALCCGAQALIIPDKGVAALGEDAVKSSAGALEHIQVCRVNSLMKTVDLLHLNGLLVYCSEMTASQPVYEVNFQIPCAVVMGGEQHGVFPGLMKIADGRFSIPMSGRFESLNVSVAAGMILYEAMKQRMRV
jgi:23S rRNA (guanosine2251-2'-O)-methyltransferase